MNEELKKMLDSINAKKQEVKDLCKAGKIEDAATAKEELKKLQAQFDLVYDLDVTKTEGMGEKAAAGAAKTIADKAKNIAGAFVNAIKAAVGKGELSTEDKEILNSMNEGKDEDGGLTVPKDIKTAIKELRRSEDALETLVNVEPVKTLSGSRVIERYADQTPFDNIVSSYSVGLDADAIREYLKGKGLQATLDDGTVKDVDECSDEEIITADTGAFVFLTGNVKILDAIEDIKMPIYI